MIQRERRLERAEEIEILFEQPAHEKPLAHCFASAKPNVLPLRRIAEQLNHALRRHLDRGDQKTVNAIFDYFFISSGIGNNTRHTYS